MSHLYKPHFQNNLIQFSTIYHKKKNKKVINENELYSFITRVTVTA